MWAQKLLNSGYTDSVFQVDSFWDFVTMTVIIICGEFFNNLRKNGFILYSRPSYWFLLCRRRLKGQNGDLSKRRRRFLKLNTQETDTGEKSGFFREIATIARDIMCCGMSCSCYWRREGFTKNLCLKSVPFGLSTTRVEQLSLIL